jgi:2,5-furandicarboxylate decarboxylase 1
MSYATADLRSFLQQAEQADLLLRIDKAASVSDEIPALCSETVRPTLFNNLRGFPDFQLCDCLTRFRDTQALALGIERGDPGLVLPGYLERIAQGPSPTVSLGDSPVKEIVWSGEDADLGRLPIPTPSEGVDFAHLNIAREAFDTPVISGGIGVTRDPEGNYNTFFTMAKVIGPQRIQFFMLPGHTQQNVEAWAARGERCPMALVIGCHPAYELGAVYSAPHPGFSEFNLISTLLGQPVPLVKCETLDLQIPALAEIVIEGFIDPRKAPYVHASSHSDSYAPILSLEPFFDVTAISMRKQPIYRHIQPTRFTEHHSLAEFIVLPQLLRIMREAGLPVRDMHMPLRSCGNCAIVQMNANNPEEVRKAMAIAMTTAVAPRLTIVVDEDVDIYNMDDVLFALSIRTSGLDDIAGVTSPQGMPEPLTVLINGPRDIQMLPNNRWAVDATRPSLAEPNRRLESIRLKARGEGRVRLADFL